MLAPLETIARVKLPPPLIFQLMRALAENQDKYEALFGPIPDHQGHRLGPPEDQGGTNAQ